VEQDLGEVVVHDRDNRGGSPWVYGLPPADRARLAGLLPSPPPASVAEARKVAAQYNTALAAGDVETALRLTGRRSQHWHPDRERMLLFSSLQPLAFGTPVQGTPALRLVPRGAVFYLGLFAASRQRPGEPLSQAAVAAEALRDDGWVFLAATSAGGVYIGAILHREENAWRVVEIPHFYGDLLSLFNMSMAGRNLPDPGCFGRPLPPLQPSRQEAALAAGRGYLQAWSSSDIPRLREITSPLSPGYHTEQFRKMHMQRPDSGELPEGVDPATLRLDTELTTWESEWLMNFVRVTDSRRGGSHAATASADKTGFPHNWIVRGDLAVLRYGSKNGDLRMLMVRHEGKWTVLEPALRQ
jgi:hypothetical protein